MNDFSTKDGLQESVFIILSSSTAAAAAAAAVQSLSSPSNPPLSLSP